MTTRRSAVDRDGKWRLSGLSLALLLGGWSAAAALLLLVGDNLGARFFDLPLGALLAGQGALVGLLVVGVRVAGSEPSDRG